MEFNIHYHVVTQTKDYFGVNFVKKIGTEVDRTIEHYQFSFCG